MAGTISFDGLATGIQTTETVDKLIEVESRPKILKEAEKARAENRVATWRDINSKLLSVSVASVDLSRLATWNTQRVTSSDESLITATASLDAAAGTYTVSVDRLATAHQIASQGFNSDKTTVGVGDLNIQLGSGTIHTVALDATNNTVDGAAAAINRANIGVTASVVNTGSEYKLLLSSNATGEANALTITTSGTVTLVFDTDNPVQAAQDAQVKLGSGAGAITVLSASNSISTLVKGVTLDLEGEEPGQAVTVTVSRNSDAIAEKVQKFVEAYNDATDYIAKQFAYDSESGMAGILMGDSAVMGIQRTLGNLVSGIVSSGSSYRSLSSVGIRVGTDGKLTFEAGKLSAAMQDDFSGTMRLFRTGGDSTNGKISFVYATNKTAESASGYAVDVTQVATRASITAASPAGLSIDENNDTFKISLDGGPSVAITLTHRADYTAESLAEEIQAKINAAVSGSVTVATDSSGVLSILSDRYGSASRITLTDQNALASLGLSGLGTSVGRDVAGTINGELATGMGQVLRGNPGNAKTDGLQLLVEFEDGLGVGAESVVTVTKGVFSRFSEYLAALTDPTTGTVGVQQNAANAALEGFSNEIKAMETRLEQRRESLMAQFLAMEKAVGQFNSQGNYLTNALANISSNWQWNS